MKNLAPKRIATALSLLLGLTIVSSALAVDYVSNRDRAVAILFGARFFMVMILVLSLGSQGINETWRDG